MMLSVTWLFWSKCNFHMGFIQMWSWGERSLPTCVCLYACLHVSMSSWAWLCVCLEAFAGVNSLCLSYLLGTTDFLNFQTSHDPPSSLTWNLDLIPQALCPRKPGTSAFLTLTNPCLDVQHKGVKWRTKATLIPSSEQLWNWMPKLLIYIFVYVYYIFPPISTHLLVTGLPL